MTIAMNVAIEIGPCEYHNQRPIRIGLVESLDGVKAAPRVQRDQEIARLASIRVIQRDTVSEFAQDAGPTGRGYAVAVLHAQRRWSDYLDFHVFRLFRAGARIVTPREAPSMLVDSTTIRGWLRRCRDFPFRFRGQPASGPLAVRLGFIPTHVDDGKFLIERNIMIEDALSPAATGFPLPI